MDKKVLIVEDTEENRMLLIKILEKEKIQATGVETAEEALQLLKNEKFSVILLDLLLPKMDGFEFLKLIKADPLFDDIYIIIISKLREKNDIIKALQSGADDYLAKPIDGLVLLNKMKMILKQIDIKSLPICDVDANKETSKIKLALPFTIHEIDEDGITFLTDFIYNKGSRFTPTGKIFEEIGIPPIKLKVEDCTLHEGTGNTKYLVKASYEDVSAELLLKIRKYILTNLFPGTE